MKPKLIVIAMAALCAGCEVGVKVESKPEAEALTTPAPEFTTQGRQEYEPASANDFQVPDPGNLVDLDGDGSTDFVKLEGECLMWSKGTTAKPVCVLVVKERCRGYYVRVLPNHKLPTFQFWNWDYRQFRQDCIGVNGKGLPIFADLEEVK